MPLAIPGGVTIWTEFAGEHPTYVLEAINASLISAGWDSAKVAAFASKTYSNPIPAGLTETFAGQVYSFVNTLSSAPYEVKVGATLADSVANLKAAINLEAGAGTLYSATTPANITITATGITDVVITAIHFYTIRVESLTPGPEANGVFTSFGKLLAGGYLLTGTSRQALQMKVYIYFDDTTGILAGSDKTICFQAISALDSTVVSNVKRLTVKSGKRFHLWAHRCGAWIYVPDTGPNQYGNVVGWEVPWIKGSVACHSAVVALDPTECWWISNDYGLDVNSTPRAAALAYDWINDDGSRAISLAGNDGCYNGVLSLGTVRWMCLTVAGRTESPINFLPVWTPKTSPQFMRLEPLVAWTKTGDSLIPRVRVLGQSYASWWRTDRNKMEFYPYPDKTYEYDGQHWFALTRDYKYGSLHLLVPTLAPESLNISYCH